MIIDATDADNILSFHTHIIDTKTGEDISTKHAISWYDTKTKRCEYTLYASNGNLVTYLGAPEEDCFEKVRCKLRNTRAVVLVSKDRARDYLEWVFTKDPEAILNRDIDLVINGDNALEIYIENLPNEKPLRWLTREQIAR